jgi:alginate O-acetyltransferase complex protein AlgI
MIFNSLTFLIFFSVVLILYRLPLSWRAKKVMLLLASYLFYAAWNPPFVVLLWISTLTDWFVGQRLANTVLPSRRRLLLFTSLIVNFGLLGYFKYAGFILNNFVTVVNLIGFSYHPLALDIILPLGISFYTFQTLSYTLSIYRGDSCPSESFLDYALFVTFFPQLVAGPIVRSRDFLPQCISPKHVSWSDFGWGLTLLTFGLFQKVVLADTLLAPVADSVYGSPAKAGLLDAWIGTFAFSGQIFFDFAGYSACAIGAARCLGFFLSENFQCPYASIGFRDFWRRWHISLSTWLRDYLYIPLGGNRRGGGRTYANLMATMLLGGLWHGAAWNFVVWGGLHGLYLAGERWLRGLFKAFHPGRLVSVRILLSLFTFLSVTITWVFFRARDFHSALLLFQAMFMGENRHLLEPFESATVGLVIVGTLVVQGMMKNAQWEKAITELPLWLRSLALGVLIVWLLLVPGDERAFIYFQF